MSGVKERVLVMSKRHAELTEDVARLEGLVEDQRKELEMQHSSRFGGMYDDDEMAITQSMIDGEEEQVRHLEEKIKNMQEKVCSLILVKLMFRLRNWMPELLLCSIWLKPTVFTAIYTLNMCNGVFRFESMTFVRYPFGATAVLIPYLRVFHTGMIQQSGFTKIFLTFLISTTVSSSKPNTTPPTRISFQICLRDFKYTVMNQAFVLEIETQHNV